MFSLAAASFSSKNGSENENAFLLHVNVRSLTDQRNARKNFCNKWKSFLERNQYPTLERPCEKLAWLLIPLHLNQSWKLDLNCDSYHILKLFACMKEQYIIYFDGKFIKGF